jgi:alkanesulfonate monooxygenase SsuD/methylene tetrahydromethanopterin reductase-like flavin-dependent oxidoreductase (luciferase family)
MILGVGLGTQESCDYERFGGSTDNRVLAEKADESLNVITGLWSGKRFRYRGKHYTLGKSVFLPTPVQKPRVPIWVGGFWPREGPFRRAARWDGVLPLKLGGSIRLQPKDLRDILSYIQKHRTTHERFDVAMIGWGTGKDRSKNAKNMTPYIDAGMNWWLESLYGGQDSADRMRERIRMGPPKIS